MNIVLPKPAEQKCSGNNGCVHCTQKTRILQKYFQAIHSQFFRDTIPAKGLGFIG
jgi:hypothetical protein